MGTPLRYLPITGHMNLAKRAQTLSRWFPTLQFGLIPGKDRVVGTLK